MGKEDTNHLKGVSLDVKYYDDEKHYICQLNGTDLN